MKDVERKTQNSRVRWVLASVLAVSLTLSLTVPLGAVQTISITNPSPNVVEVRIDQPIVTQPLTPYPTVVFHPGDQVTVQAGGCVQTGGLGKTWKRYVNPSGPNSDRLYHGLIQIPGATIGMVRISTIVNHTLTISSSVDLAGQAFLKLGYEDDGYGDNGYWGHDDGTGDQCKGSDGGDAWLTLNIVHGGTPPPPNPEYPYDLTWNETDGNGFPFDPRWVSQVPPPGQLPGEAMCGYPWLAPCTSQAPVINKGTICSLGQDIGQAGQLGGHANWGAASYDGYATWDGHSSPGTDDDYNINVTRSDDAYYTSDNPNNVHTEFDSDETVDHFNTPWWSAFHNAVDSSDSAAAQFINGKYILETGVAGLDCAHSCGSELHPVFALALHIDDNAAADGWAIFARNWGDEGFCGAYEVGLDVTSLSLTIPWRAGATAVTIRDASEFQTNSSKIGGPTITPVAGQAVNITFTFPSPESLARVNGVLYLQWTGAPTATLKRPAIPVARVFSSAIPATLQKETEPEDRISALVAGMSPELQKEYAAITPPKNISKDSIVLHYTVKTPAPTAHPPVAHAFMVLKPGEEVLHGSATVNATFVGKKLPAIRLFPNAQKAALDQKRIAIIRKAYPNIPVPATNQ
jgi:hypothetical protein